MHFLVGKMRLAIVQLLFVVKKTETLYLVLRDRSSRPLFRLLSLGDNKRCSPSFCDSGPFVSMHQTHCVAKVNDRADHAVQVNQLQVSHCAKSPLSDQTNESSQLYVPSSSRDYAGKRTQAI